jgi:hypothetical protein
LARGGVERGKGQVWREKERNEWQRKERRGRTMVKTDK